MVGNESEAAMLGQVPFVVGGLADRVPEYEATIHDEVLGCESEQIGDQLVQIVLDLLRRVRAVFQVLLRYFEVLFACSDFQCRLTNAYKRCE